MRMQRRPYMEAAERNYPNVRSALSERYRGLPAEQLDELVQETFGPAFALEDAEGFLQTLARVGQIAAPIVLPAIGTAIGGPVGTAVGAIGGSMVSQALGGVADGPQPGTQPQGGAPARRQRAAAPRPARPGRPPTRATGHAFRMPSPGVLAGGAAAVTAATAPAAAAQPATGLQSPAAQLAGILGRPEFLLALASAMFGGAGRPTVPVGDDDVPIGALLNLPNVLGQAAQVDNHLLQGGGTEAVPAYLISESGETLCDVTDDRERADVLLRKLGEVASAEATYFESDEGAEWDAPEDFFDAWELAILELDE